MRIDGPPARVASIHDAVNQVGDGGMSLPNTYDRFDDILLLNRATPANSVSSLVRCRNDDGTIGFEWLPDSMVPASSKQDPEVEVGGRGIKSIASYPVTEPYDWDGSADWSCSACDWIWGGANILGNPFFSATTITAKVFQLTISATGGTYTLTDGTDTTAAINWNDGASTIQTRLETDIAALTEVVVSSAGPGTYLIQMIEPPFGVNLSINVGSLTGGTGAIITTVEGGRKPDPWTRTRSLIAGIPQDQGNYTTWALSSAQAHSGTLSLLIDPGSVGSTFNRLAGAQQVINVTPGQTYQASIWIYPTSGTDTYRLGIFTVGDDLIEWTSGVGLTYTPNTWNQIVLPDVIIPEGVTQVIFRLANTNQFPTNPAAFYLDDAEFTEGLAATTAGEIIRLLYESYIDPALRSPIVWDDGSATDTPYLTLGFTDSLDSAGAAWSPAEISLRVFVRMTLKQVLDLLASQHGIEWEIVPDDPEAGTWLLNVYNEAGMDTAPDVAIQGSSADVQRRLRRFLPFTDYTVEGGKRVTGRASNAYQSALGRMETARIDPTITTAAGAGVTADQDAIDGEAIMDSVSYELTGGQVVPLQTFRLGDTVTVDDPPEVEDTATRFWEVYGTMSTDGDDFTCEFLLP
jgi:hypothetical protein